MRYLVDYGTMTEEMNGTLDEVMKQVDDGLAYTQESVSITDEDGTTYTRQWRGVELNEDDFDPFDIDKVVTFGDYGYYEPWAGDDGEYL